MIYEYYNHGVVVCRVCDDSNKGEALSL